MAEGPERVWDLLQQIQAAIQSLFSAEIFRLQESHSATKSIICTQINMRPNVMGSFQVDKREFVESDESLEQKGERMGLEDLRKTWKERHRKANSLNLENKEPMQNMENKEGFDLCLSRLLLWLSLRPLSITRQLLTLMVELPPAGIIKHECLVGIFTHTNAHMLNRLPGIIASKNNKVFLLTATNNRTQPASTYPALFKN